MAENIKLNIPPDRTERLQYIKRMFPQASGPSLSDAWQGGRHEAIRRLSSLDIDGYNRNREFINGAVSGLSPYLRYGCLTLKEVLDSVRLRFGVKAEKLIQALAWRDYWRRVWYDAGDKIFSDMEESKVPLGDKLMPDYIRQGITGLPCMDAIVRDLMLTGYVHGNARKWFAAYIVHWLKVDWREAADWFESYLIDGDKGSNHLSWQWVASRNSSRPFYFNKEELARFTGEKYCSTCKINCPFDAEKEVLERKLFGDKTSTPAKTYPPRLFPITAVSTHKSVAIFVHDEMLSPANPLLHNPMPQYFVFDDRLHGKWPLKRLQFVADCLSEMRDVEVWRGNVGEVLRAREVGQLVTQNTPNRQVRSLLEPFQVTWQAEPNFTEVGISEKRLKRFSRYWEKVGQDFFGENYLR